MHRIPRVLPWLVAAAVTIAPSTGAFAAAWQVVPPSGGGASWYQYPPARGGSGTTQGGAGGATGGTGGTATGIPPCIGDGWYRPTDCTTHGGATTAGGAGSTSGAGSSTGASTGGGATATSGGTAGASSGGTGGASSGGTGGASTGGVTLTADEQQLFDAVNQLRQSHGLAPLALNATLVNLARAKSQDMVTHNYFGHDSPDLGTPLQMQQNAGLRCQVMGGENIAGAANIALAIFYFENSAPHLANILYPAYTVTGVGVVPDGPYGVYVTEEFAGGC